MPVLSNVVIFYVPDPERFCPTDAKFYLEKTQLFSFEESLLRTIGLTKRNLFWLPCQKHFNKSPKKVDCKTKKVMETFFGKRFAKQSCWHAGCFDNDTVKKYLPWFRKQTARSLKNWENEAFLTDCLLKHLSALIQSNQKEPWSKY